MLRSKVSVALVMLILASTAGCKKKGGFGVRVGELPDATYKVRIRCTQRSAVPADGLFLNAYVNGRAVFTIEYNHHNKRSWSKWYDISTLVNKSGNTLTLKGNHGLAEVEYVLTRDGTIASSGFVGHDKARSLGVNRPGAKIEF